MEDPLPANNGGLKYNYAQREPSVSYLRSALYFLAYTVIEQFPDLARAFVDGLAVPGSDEVAEFLDGLR